MALGEWEFQDDVKTSPIIKGKIKRAKKVIIYGPEGVGKSTFASWFPKPLVIDVERSADELEVDKIDCRDKTYNEICELIGEHGFDYKTIIIDTFDWFEEKIIEHVCKEGGGVNHAFAARLGAFRMARRGERARQSYKLHRPKELEDISTLCHF